MKILLKNILYLSFVRRHTKFGLKIFEIKGIKHIRWDFHSAAWVMPKGWDLGGRGLGGFGGVKKLFSEIQTPNLVCELLT